MIKKALLLVILSLAFVKLAISQFSVSLEIAPSLPLSGVAIPGFVDITPDGVIESKIATLGAGVGFTGSVFYDLNESFAVGLETTIFNSFKGSTKQHNVDGAGSVTIKDFSASAFYLTPTVRFAVNERFYSKLGLAMGLSLKVEAEERVENSSFIGNEKQKFDGNEKGMPLGVSAAFGYTSDFSDRISWFAELQFLNMVYRPAQLVTTQVYQGEGPIPEISISDKKPIADQLVIPSFPIPFSSYGVGIGIIYKL